jgi:hypothetical protein
MIQHLHGREAEADRRENCPARRRRWRATARWSDSRDMGPQEAAACRPLLELKHGITQPGVSARERFMARIVPYGFLRSGMENLIERKLNRQQLISPT